MRASGIIVGTMDAPPVQFTRTSDGVSIAYMVWPGRGIPFLRIRNLGAMPMALDATMEDVRRFAGDRPMVWFDWRGTGQSARQVSASMDDLLLDIDAVMSVIDSEVVDVLAPGMACLIACTYAVSRGARWRSLVLTDPNLQVEGSPQGVIVRPGWEADYEGFLVSMARSFLSPMSNQETERVAESWAETVPLEAWRAFRSLERSIDLTGTLGAIDMPVLILKVFPRSRADSVAALIPDSILLARRSGIYGRHLRELWDEYIGSKFADPPPATAARASSNGLSPRELDVLRLLAAGKSNKHIAEALVLSEATIATHVRHILQKTDSANRVEATAYAVRNGLA
ncbi:MAG: hypothetical protein Kow0010_22680 [Dehalococcoidia bacterium]